MVGRGQRGTEQAAGSLLRGMVSTTGVSGGAGAHDLPHGAGAGSLGLMLAVDALRGKHSDGLCADRLKKDGPRELGTFLK